MQIHDKIGTHKTQTCNLSRSERFLSTSGRSLLSASLRHCDWRLPLVTVKLMKVTREHKSGENSAVGSRVVRKMVNDGDKSMSWSPMVIRTRPPLRRNSLRDVIITVGWCSLFVWCWGVSGRKYLFSSERQLNFCGPTQTRVNTFSRFLLQLLEMILRR